MNDAVAMFSICVVAIDNGSHVSAEMHDQPKQEKVTSVRY
jgi:hypothetical protein